MKKIIALILSLALVFSFSAFAFAAGDEETLPFDNSSFFTDADYNIHYRTFTPNGEIKNQIMLLHGFGLSTVSFEGIAGEYMNAGYKVVLVDLPNFGYSTRETLKMNLLDREEIVADLMKELGGKWIAGGHSMGGGVAANVAIENPDLVTGLVLFAPQTSVEPTPFMSKLMKSFFVRTMFELVIRLGSRIDAAIEMLVAYSFSDAGYAKNYDVSRISDPLKIKSTGSSIAIMSSHAKGTDYEAFGNLEIPIVIVTASNDLVASKESIDKLIDSSPKNLTVYNCEKGGHMMMEYNPLEAFNATIGTIENASASLAA